MQTIRQETMQTIRQSAPQTTVSIRLAERYGQGATVDVVPRWRGAALCVHAPIRDGAPTATRGEWTVTAHAYGYAAGTFRGPLRDAIALARLWDRAFQDGLAAAPRDLTGIPTLAAWSQRLAWQRQVDRYDPPTGPVEPDHPNYRAATDASRERVAAPRERVATTDGDGAEQFPATPTMTPVVVDGARRVRLSRRLPDGRQRLRDADGNAVRMNGDVAAFKGADPLTPVLRLWFASAWRDVPSIAQLMEWTLDGVAETPDGSRVESDAPTSWLTLLGVV
jgi:hypothetical protein